MEKIEELRNLIAKTWERERTDLDESVLKERIDNCILFVEESVDSEELIVEFITYLKETPKTTTNQIYAIAHNLGSEE